MFATMFRRSPNRVLSLTLVFMIFVNFCFFYKNYKRTPTERFTSSNPNFETKFSEFFANASRAVKERKISPEIVAEIFTKLKNDAWSMDQSISVYNALYSREVANSDVQYGAKKDNGAGHNGVKQNSEKQKSAENDEKRIENIKQVDGTEHKQAERPKKVARENLEIPDKKPSKTKDKVVAPNTKSGDSKINQDILKSKAKGLNNPQDTSKIGSQKDSNVERNTKEKVEEIFEEKFEKKENVETEDTSQETNLAQKDKGTDLPEVHQDVVTDNNSCTDHHDKLVGRLLLDKMEKSPETILANITYLQLGGSFTPQDCVPKENTVIIIPFRNRTPHLHILLYNLLPVLYRQRVQFTILVVEQDNSSPFNRGMLLNVGFLEANKLGNFDCFIFHDVDLVPVNDQNYYHCNEHPTHFISGVDKFKYRLSYQNMFGGVTAFTKTQFLKINGASNLYFGWGGEDDDLNKRVHASGMKRLRKYRTIGLYDMVKHKRDEGNAKNPVRSKLLKLATHRQQQEGLNSTHYTQISLQKLELYTWVKVHIDIKEVLKTAPAELKKEANRLLDIATKKKEVDRKLETAAVKNEKDRKLETAAVKNEKNRKLETAAVKNEKDRKLETAAVKKEDDRKFETTTQTR